MPLSIPAFMKLFPKKRKPAVITFRHAGYPIYCPKNVLMRLRVSSNGSGGVHAGTALTALRIIADNAFEVDTWLTTTREGRRVSTNHDSLLQNPEYWFHVANPDDPMDYHYEYPVVPSFQMWSMPRYVPDPWTLERSPEYVMISRNEHGVTRTNMGTGDREQSAHEKPCILSGESSENCQRTEIFPASEYIWWTEEWRKRWVTSPYKAIKHAREFRNNFISLRSDLAQAFRQGDFVIVPKKKAWVAHFFDPSTGLGREFDGKRLNFQNNVSVEHLFPRFAFEVFEQVNGIQEGDSLVRIS